MFVEVAVEQIAVLLLHRPRSIYVWAVTSTTPIRVISPVDRSRSRRRFRTRFRRCG
jgi:hypothetical protein